MHSNSIHRSFRVHRFHLTLIVALISFVVAVSLASSPAFAQAPSAPPVELDDLSPAERKLFAELLLTAQRHFENQEYALAVRTLEKAQVLFAEPYIQLRIAQALEARGDHWEALQHYQTFLNAVPQAKERNAVEDRIAALQRQTQAQLSVRSDPDGASIFVGDDTPSPGKTPMTLSLPPGQYSIRVVKEGYEAQQEVVELLPQGVATLRLALRPTVKDPAVRAVSPNPPSQPLSQDQDMESATTSWVLLGVGASASVATAFLFNAYLVADNELIDLEELRRPDQERPADYNDQVDELRAERDLYLVLGTVGAATALLATIAAVVYWPSSNKQASKPPTSDLTTTLEKLTRAFDLTWTPQASTLKFRVHF